MVLSKQELSKEIERELPGQLAFAYSKPGAGTVAPGSDGNQD
jgi:hypothetical protein